MALSAFHLLQLQSHWILKNIAFCWRNSFPQWFRLGLRLKISGQSNKYSIDGQYLWMMAFFYSGVYHLFLDWQISYIELIAPKTFEMTLSSEYFYPWVHQRQKLLRSTSSRACSESGVRYTRIFRGNKLKQSFVYQVTRKSITDPQSWLWIQEGFLAFLFEPYNLQICLASLFISFFDKWWALLTLAVLVLSGLCKFLF